MWNNFLNLLRFLKFWVYKVFIDKLFLKRVRGGLILGFEVVRGDFNYCEKIL